MKHTLTIDTEDENGNSNEISFSYCEDHEGTIEMLLGGDHFTYIELAEFRKLASKILFGWKVDEEGGRNE